MKQEFAPSVLGKNNIKLNSIRDLDADLMMPTGREGLVAEVEVAQEQCVVDKL